MKASKFRLAMSLILVGMTFGGCATETNHVVETHQVESAARPYSGPKSTVVVGKFDNRSSFMSGIFSHGIDCPGGQAKTILITHLQQTGRFSVVDRDNLEEIKREAGFK